MFPQLFSFPHHLVVFFIGCTRAATLVATRNRPKGAQILNIYCSTPCGAWSTPILSFSRTPSPKIFSLHYIYLCLLHIYTLYLNAPSNLRFEASYPSCTCIESKCGEPPVPYTHQQLHRGQLVYGGYCLAAFQYTQRSYAGLERCLLMIAPTMRLCRMPGMVKQRATQYFVTDNI